MYRLGRLLLGTAPPPHLVPVFFTKKLVQKPKAPPPVAIPPEDLCLANLRDNPGAKKKKQRLGRGISSSRGRSCGRGQRHDTNHHPGHQGGQMPLHRQLPKVAATMVSFEDLMVCVTLGDLQAAIDTGRLSPHVPITPKVLVDCNIIREPRWPGVRITAEGYDWFSTKVHVEANWCDPDACTVIEAHGGTARSVYQDKDFYDYTMRPERFAPGLEPKPQLPPPRLWHRYAEERIRGYLVGQEEKWYELVDRVTFKWTPELQAQREKLLAEEFERREDEKRQRRRKEWERRMLAEIRAMNQASQPLEGAPDGKGEATADA
eukprot:EG_transcript_16116